MRRMLFVLAALLLSEPLSYAAPQTRVGTVRIDVAGTFKTAVSTAILPPPSVQCTGVLALVPLNGSTTLSTMTLLQLAAGGSSQVSVQGTIAASRRSFVCTITLPYKWENVDPATTQMIVAYTVNPHDQGGFSCTPPTGACIVLGTNPSKRQEIINTLPIPANGTTTAISVAPQL